MKSKPAKSARSAVQLAYLYARFSSPEQANGDSLRRQLSMAESWCKANGFTLDESTTYKDRGVSGFRGKHRTEGALAAFLADVRQGTIPAGSVLLIENIDRLSRENAWDFIGLIFELVKLGVRVVQLDTGEVIDQQTDMFVLMRMMMSQYRGHDESRKKSDRINAVWDNWRATGQSRAGTVRPGAVPFWLSKKDGKYKLNDKAEVVRQIVRWATDGWGVQKIHAELRRRQMKVIVKKNSDGYIAQPYLNKVLQSPVLYGRCEEIDRDGYFPAVITREEFFHLQGVISGRTRKGKRTRTRDRVHLLSGIIENIDTGGHYSVRRWQHVQRHVYYPFDVRTHGRTDTTSFPVEELEAATIEAVKELVPGEIFGKKRADVMSGLVAEADQLKAKIANLEAEMEEAEGEVKAVVRVVGRLEERLAEVNAKIAEERVKLASPAVETLAQCKRLCGMDLTDDENRLRLRAALGNLIERIRVEFRKAGVWRLAYCRIELKQSEHVREVGVAYCRPLVGLYPQYSEIAAYRKFNADGGVAGAEVCFAYLGKIVERVNGERAKVIREKSLAYHREWDRNRRTRNRKKTAPASTAAGA